MPQHVNRRNHRPFSLHSLSLALLVGLSASLPGMTAHADSTQAEVRQYNIPAGPLSQVLGRFSAEAGILLSSDAALTDGKRSPGLRGSYSVAEALDLLLAGSGLQAVRDAEGQYLLRGPGTGALVLAPISVTSQQAGSDIYRTPQAVFHVDRERLDRIPQSTPSDLFNGIPGVQMANAGSQGSFDPNIRGMQGHGRVKVLLDGTDTTQASRVTYSGNRSQNYVEPDFIAGIDVAKGPGLESGGMGGTISMRTFNVDDIISDPDKNWGLRVRGMLGDNSGDNSSTLSCTSTSTVTGIQTQIPNPSASCIQGYAGYNSYVERLPYDSGADIPSGNRSGSLIGAWQPLDNLGLLIGYARRQSGNYSAGESGKVARDYPTSGYFFDVTPKEGFSYYKPGDEVYGTFTDNESILAKAAANLGDHRLAFTYNRFDGEYVFSSGVSTQSAARAWAYYPPASNTRQDRYSLDYAWQPANELIDLKANAWFADTQENLYAELNVSTLKRDDVQTDSYGYGFSNTSLLGLWSRSLTLKVGGQYKNEQVDSNTEVNGLEVEQYGLFTSASLPVTDWLTLDAGIRYDDYQTTVDSSQYYRVAEENGDNATSTHAGITLQPFEPLQVFVRYAEGFRAPSMRENTLSNAAGGWERFQPNPGRPDYWAYRPTQGVMKPERSETVEVGANLALSSLLRNDDRLGIKVSRFDNTVSDYIYGSGTTVLPFENIDEVRMVGYEASLSYDAGAVFADYAFTYYDKVEACGTDYRNPGQCKEFGSFDDLRSLYGPAKRRHDITLGVRLLDRKLTLGANANIVRGTGWEYDGMQRYDVYDLFASYAFGKFDFALSAENVTDQYYFEAGTGSAWPLPAAGRTVRGTVTARF